MQSHIFLIALTTALISVSEINCEKDPKKWQLPNAWGGVVPFWGNEKATTETEKLETTTPVAACPVCETLATVTADDTAFKYYKRFAVTLFNRNKLVYNKNAAKYQRSIMFNLLPAQLEKLEQLTDPRDLDSMLTEIIAAAKAINQLGEHIDDNSSIWALLKDMAKDAWQLLKISEVRFTLLVASVILLCWFLHKRYHIGILTLTMSSFFLFGYFLTYLECNRNLEIEEFVEFVGDDTAQSNGFLSSWFGTKTSTSSTREKLKKSRKFKLPFCRPDHVLLMYTNELFLKQLEYLIEKFTHTMEQFSTTLKFPYNYIAPCLLVALMCYLLKLTYKYILTPKAWASLWHGRQHHYQTYPTAFVAPGNAALESGDRLSGENLNLLLHAIKVANTGKTATVAEKRTLATSPTVSGVEDVLEAVEDKNSEDSLDDATSSSADNATSSCMDNQSNEKSNFETVQNSSNSKSFSESDIR